MAEDFDKEDLEKFEAKETAHTLPKGWLILFWGLIVWGVFYLYAFSPQFGGWSQEKAYEESVKK